MVMADIWLTVAARSALEKLSPGQAGAVHAAIRDIPSKHGQRFNIPGAPPAEPFLAVEPENPDAPVVIYRRTTTHEQGDWLVVSLMNTGAHTAVRRPARRARRCPQDPWRLPRRTRRRAIPRSRSASDPGHRHRRRRGRRRHSQ